jgi:hypothetical protein
MLKSELVEKVAKANPDLYERDAQHIVEAILKWDHEGIVAR